MIEHHEETNLSHSGNESLDSLHISELKLTKMVEATGQPAGSGGGSAPTTQGGDGEDGADEQVPAPAQNRTQTHARWHTCADAHTRAHTLAPKHTSA